MKRLLLLSVTFLILTANPTFAQWSQLGTDLDGVTADNYFGAVALSADGSRLAVGARQGDTIIYRGYVHVYDWNGSAWVMVGARIYGEAGGDNSGKSVSLNADGSRLAIGAPSNGTNNGLNNEGQVRVYNWNGSAWVQMGSDIDGQAQFDNLGWNVVLSADGNRLAASAPFNNSGGLFRGHIKIFDWNGSGWVQAGSSIYGDSTVSYFGTSHSMSADGNRVAVGSVYNNQGIGTVYIYEWNGSNWMQMGSDINGQQASAEFFGASVSLNADGNRVAIGGDGIDTTGGVRVYDWNGSAWVQAGSDITGGATDNSFGWASSISADGNRLAIGDYNNWSTDTSSGQVRVYDWNGSDWVQAGSNIDGEAKGDESGRFVCLSADGKRVAIGAPYNGGNGHHSGHARVYEYPTTTGVKEHNNATAFIKVFPNSFSHQLTFALANNNEQATVSIFDFLARQILQQSFTNSTTINTEQFANGIYFYELRNDKEVIKIGKVVKQ